MLVTYHVGGLELFGRTAPPETCVYSPAYARAVRVNAEKRLASLRNIPRLYNAFIYQDEPFHAGPKSFGYNSEVRAEFMQRYGYELPPDLDSVRHDPRKWNDIIDLRSSYFPDGWRQVLLGFCLQDTYFKTWEDGTSTARAQLWALLRAMTQAAGIRPHVASSNADIEAAVRANEREGFLFIINHEAKDPETTVYMADLPCKIGAITDLGSGRPVAFTRVGQDKIKRDFSVPLGEVLLCVLTPAAESGHNAPEGSTSAPRRSEPRPRR